MMLIIVNVERYKFLVFRILISILLCIWFLNIFLFFNFLIVLVRVFYNCILSCEKELFNRFRLEGIVKKFIIGSWFGVVGMYIGDMFE